MQTNTKNTMTRLDETTVSNLTEIGCTAMGNNMPKPAKKTAITRTQESNICNKVG